MAKTNDFTKGGIFLPLLKFSLPILLALILQAAYGAVDLWMVGKFATPADMSAVSSGSQLMHSITVVVAGLATGTTVQLGQTLGQKKPEEAGPIIGASVALFTTLAIVLTALVLLLAGPLAAAVQAPAEAVSQTVAYIRMCGAGLLFITAYNLFGGIFRGMGDSQTPLLTVFIACIVNVVGDYVLVAIVGLGALGAAIATVAAQGVSVLISLLIVRHRGLPFPFSRSDIQFHWGRMGRIVRLGAPISLQDGLVSVSFLVILAIVNSLGLVASAGVGVAEKLCNFIMLVPSAFSQSITSFVAQNVGAGRLDRARQALARGILASLAFGVVIGWFSFVHGVILTSFFNKDPVIASAAADYLKAYSIDCVLTAFLFPFIGYFGGMGRTKFVMVQGLVGAFCVRVPVSFLMSRLTPVSLFRVGLATPCSSLVQIILCGGYFLWLKKHSEPSLPQ
jgi:putative MATE family efflux protein